MKQLVETIEAERQDKEIIKLLDEIYEEEKFMREAQEYGYGNYKASSNNYNMYMNIEYGYIAN
jgi:hypothetical protein